MSGGCITQQWTSTLEVSEQVIDLLAREPGLIARFEALHQKHARSLPRFLRWGRTHMTKLELDRRRTGCVLTSCTHERGLVSACWYASLDSRRPR